jgi:outer membrane protein TolC
MKSRHYISIIIIVLLTIQNVYAQKVVTIDQCIEWAVSQSSENTQKSLNDQILKVKLNDVSSHLYPTLELNGQIGYQSDQPHLPASFGLDPLSNDYYGISMDFSQVLYDGNQFIYNRQFEKLKNQNEIIQIDLSINQLKERIITIYLNLLIVDKQIQLIETVEKTLEDQIDRFQKLLKEGVANGNTVAQFELEQLKIQQQKGELKQVQSSLKQSLSILTGQSVSDAEFTVPQLSATTSDLDSKRLEFTLFQNTISGLDFQRKLSISNSLPKISLYATGGYGRPAYNIFSNNFEWYYNIGLKINVPIISWAKTAGIGDIIQLQKKLINSKQSDFTKFNQIAIQEKINEIVKIENLIILDQQIVEKYRELTQSYRQQLENGTITVYDYIKQQNDELQSLINKEVHNMQLIKAKYELKALKGIL